MNRRIRTLVVAVVLSLAALAPTAAQAESPDVPVKVGPTTTGIKWA